MKKLSTKTTILAMGLVFAFTQISTSAATAVIEDYESDIYTASVQEEICKTNFLSRLGSCFTKLLTFRINKCKDYVAEDNLLNNYMLGESSVSFEEYECTAKNTIEEDILTAINVNEEYMDIINDISANLAVRDADMASALDDDSDTCVMADEYINEDNVAITEIFPVAFAADFYEE